MVSTMTPPRSRTKVADVDTAFITSSVRKRKPVGEPAAAPHDQKKGKPAAEIEEEKNLFSPIFHLHPSEDAFIARPITPPMEQTSTDQSTGTAMSLEVADGEWDIRVKELMALASPSAEQGVITPSSPALVPLAPLISDDDDEEVEEEDDDDFLDFDPYVFIKGLPPLEKCILPRSTFLLPRQTRHSKKKTLVLDLDETLVHSTLEGYCQADFTFPVDVGAVRHHVMVRKRPHLHTFLKKVADLFEIVVFTASQRCYAEQLLDILDPNKILIRHRVYRESCVFWEGNYLKDLTALGRDLAHTLIIDNSPQAFGFQLDNGVPITSWYDDDSDEELLKLLPFLESVAMASDVRPLIRDTFKLRELVKAAPSLPGMLTFSS